MVSLTGATGAREALLPHLADFAERACCGARAPGGEFGISTPEQARAVGQLADGVIVGSALIRSVGEAADPVKAAANFVRGLRIGLES